MSDKKNKREVVVGIKQTLRMVEQDCISEVYIARDADFYVVEPIINTAQAKDVPVTYVDTRKKLGRMCGIDTGAAAAGRIKRQ